MEQICILANIQKRLSNSNVYPSSTALVVLQLAVFGFDNQGFCTHDLPQIASHHNNTRERLELREIVISLGRCYRNLCNWISSPIIFKMHTRRGYLKKRFISRKFSCCHISHCNIILIKKDVIMYVLY